MPFYGDADIIAADTPPPARFDAARSPLMPPRCHAVTPCQRYSAFAAAMRDKDIHTCHLLLTPRLAVVAYA